MTRRTPQPFTAIVAGPVAAGTAELHKSLLLHDVDGNEIGFIELTAVPAGIRVDVYNTDETLSAQVISRVSGPVQA